MTTEIKPQCPVTAGLATRMTEAAFAAVCEIKRTPRRISSIYQMAIPMRCKHCKGRPKNWPPELQIMEANMNASKKTKPAAPVNKPIAELDATGFAVDQIRQALGCAPDEDVLDKAKATVNHLALTLTALDKSERMRDEDFRGLVDVLKSYGLPVGDALDPSKVVELMKRALAGLDERIAEACDILGVPENKRGLEAMMTNLRQKYSGLERQNDYLRREIMDAKRILGIDDPHGMLLDERGALMGDIVAAWTLVKQEVQQTLRSSCPDNMPDACRALVKLSQEQRERMDAALNNLALHTSATEIEDAAAEVSGKLEDAETRLERLENERLRQALADPEFPPSTGPIAMGTLNITSIDGGNENARIVRDLMRKIVDGQITIIHNI